MGIETEVKLRVVDEPALRERLESMGARRAAAAARRTHETNLLFDAADRRLAKQGQLMRIRTEIATESGGGKMVGEQRVVLTFKRPAGGEGEEGNAVQYKIREELELEIGDGKMMARILEGLGMRSFFRYEKYRTTFEVGEAWAEGLLIEMDETPIGTFLELEGPKEGICRAAERLGYTERDFIVRNYLGLYLEHCRERGLEPGDMVFDANG